MPLTVISILHLFILFLEGTTNMSHITSVILPVAKFLIYDFEKVFNMEFLGMCMIISMQTFTCLI
jgi:hypothetical protein